MSRHWTDGREGHDPGTWDECRKCAADRTPLRAALERLVAEAEPDEGDEGFIDYLVPADAIEAARAALSDTQDGAVGLERAAIAAAARLEGEVSRLRTELARCTEAYESEGLDMERLARAFMEVQPTLYGQDWPRDDPLDFQFINPREHAEAIAAAYAATPPPQPGEPG